MRTLCLLILALGVSACTTSLERRADSASKHDCQQQAQAHVRANMASIANEWRQHEEYKHYQRCLSRSISGSS